MASDNTYETVSETIDLPTKFTVPVGDNVLTCERTDPYGFWYFSFRRGVLPRILEGAFAGESQARRAVSAYFAVKKKD